MWRSTDLWRRIVTSHTDATLSCVSTLRSLPDRSLLIGGCQKTHQSWKWRQRGWWCPACGGQYDWVEPKQHSSSVLCIFCSLLALTVCLSLSHYLDVLVRLHADSRMSGASLTLFVAKKRGYGRYKNVAGRMTRRCSKRTRQANVQEKESFIDVVYDGIKENSGRKVVAALRPFIDIDNRKAFGLGQVVAPTSLGDRSGGPHL